MEKHFNGILNKPLFIKAISRFGLKNDFGEKFQQPYKGLNRTVIYSNLGDTISTHSLNLTITHCATDPRHFAQFYTAM